MSYFGQEESIYSQYGTNVEQTLSTIAERYIGANPSHPFVYRLFNREGFTRLHDYRYDMDVAVKWPDMRNGQVVYAWAKLWMDQPAELNFGMSCYGPAKVYINGKLAYASNISDDVAPERKNVFRGTLNKGWNPVVVQYLKTASGCGGQFGTGSYKNFPLHFMNPTAEREGWEGWIYSEPTEADLLPLLADGLFERDNGLRWYPSAQWSETELALGVFGRQFDTEAGRSALAWTKVESLLPGRQLLGWRGSHEGSFALYVNGELTYSAPGSGAFRVDAELAFGLNDVVVVSECQGGSWGFRLECADNSGSRAVAWQQPVAVKGLADHWLYLGTFAQEMIPAVRELGRMHHIYDNGGESTYWRADYPETWVRPYLENALFGKWNYPLGVTLYGLMQTGAALGRGDYVDYVLRHIEQCTAVDAYSLWDAARYGAPGVNNQLALMDSLDDCGSFGATMLTATRFREPEGARAVAGRIAHYITQVQDRLADGALYRVRGSVDFMKDTLWCDDLYMSVPFMCRYYDLTQDKGILDDAAKQMLLYKKYLYMPELQIMSHVYDFKFNKQTEVPWGRGNGWVLFSLAELLLTLPEEHDRRGELLAFFCELCAGYLRLQGTNGLWHQVLTDPESYEETSCTSMFLYAFARGVRLGWLPDAQPYVRAVRKGWEGLTRISIDKHGHIYGVCRGSGYSFAARYYKDELSWLLNDTHGIGIVMLAGVEVRSMIQDLQTQKG